MEIRITEVEPPMFSEHTMFAELSAKEFVENKKIMVIAQSHTTTRIHTAVQCGDARNGVNWKVPGFKTHEEREYNFLTGDITYPNYFVRSKRQNKEVYLDYIKAILNQLMGKLNIDILKVTFIDRYKKWN